MQHKQGAAEPRTRAKREDLLLAAVGVALGLGAALGYAVWRAANVDPGASAWGEFGSSILFPGTLVVAAIAAMVWLGWKANID